MAAQVVKKLPEGDDWTYKLKFDGYRTNAREVRREWAGLSGG